MPSINYMNNSAPFWDFIAGLEQQGQTHPFFAQNQNNNTERGEGHQQPDPFNPWGWGHAAFGGRGFPHRGPPAPGAAANEQPSTEKNVEKETEKGNDNGEGPSNTSGSDNEATGWGGSRRHGHCGGRRGRHGGGPHGHHGPGGFGGPGPHHGPHHRGRHGGWGGPWSGHGGPFAGAPFNPFAFAAGLFDPASHEAGPDSTDKAAPSSSEDFTPEADIFDTSSSFIIHVSLPGAKKEDVGVNWDAEKSELAIAGVIYRIGDEEFIKTLAMDGRKVGPFERKVRLGTRANPAQVDAEGITAKLEDGVLRVEVPKLEGEFVEVRKVDVE